MCQFMRVLHGVANKTDKQPLDNFTKYLSMCQLLEVDADPALELLVISGNATFCLLYKNASV